MHQEQWLAVLEELGGLKGVHPIPNSFPQEEELQDYNYVFLGFKKRRLRAAAGPLVERREHRRQRRIYQPRHDAAGPRTQTRAAQAGLGAQNEQMDGSSSQTTTKPKDVSA